jgi:RNA polymerase sigma-70 factor (ECF subfamily)
VAAGRLGRVLQYLRQADSVRAGLTDGQLLDHFIARGEEAAFEALLRRHGPMVLGVCRRVLNHDHDAEDAFQATFLVLVRKAASIVPRERVGNWLYGVAYRTALKARAAAAKRRVKERRARPLPQRDPNEDPVGEDVRLLLDRELNRLPEKYRLPIVLCDLEGRTRKEVARQLGWPEGTLSSRLATARTRLARRLSRQSGLALSGGAFALALAQGAAAAGVPGPLVTGTVKAATQVAAGQAAAVGAISVRVGALMEGVLRAMLLSRLKIATAVLFGLAVLGAGTGWLAGWTPTAEGQAVSNNKRAEGDKLPAQPDPRRPRGTADKKEESGDDPETKQKDLEKKLEEMKRETERMTRQHAILEIEIAVKKLKQSKDGKEQEQALGKILQAVQNYRAKVLKIPPDVEKRQYDKKG